MCSAVVAINATHRICGRGLSRLCSMQYREGYSMTAVEVARSEFSQSARLARDGASQGDVNRLAQQ